MGHEVTHLRDISDYERYYESKTSGTKTEVEVFGSEFVSAFQTEFGISPIHLAEAAEILTQDAVAKETTVVEATRETVKAVLLEKGRPRVGQQDCSSVIFE